MLNSWTGGIVIRANTGPSVDPVLPMIVRGVGFATAAGAVVGGVVGTIDWPVVVTFFGALTGVGVGAVTGAVDGLVLAVVARWTRSRWFARGASGLVWLVAALLATSTGEQLAATRHLVGRAPVVAVCLLLGAAVGPLIARGVEPVTGARGPAVGLPQIAGRLLLWGAAVGGGLGAIAGVIIGIRAYWPTAPAALVEGAVFGAVSGVVLAFLLAAVAVLPRLRARR